MKKALITGITGQDGSYLAEFLLDKGYDVTGIMRRSSSFNTGRITHIYRIPQDKTSNFHLEYGDLTDTSNLVQVIQKVQPDEIYNLGAQSHVKVSFEQAEYTANADGLGLLRILEAVRTLGLEKKTKIYQAGTSEMFGNAEPAQNETTPMIPRSPYGAAKLYAHNIACNYREAYGMFITNGILFNHESPRRGETFVTRKITRAVTRIVLGIEDKLYLGNLNAKRDWGHAKDYVRAMWMMLQHEEPEDFVIATNKSTSVRSLAITAFKMAGLNIEFTGSGKDEIGIDTSTGKTVVSIDKKYYRPTEVDNLQGDYSKAKEKLGWEPTISLYELIREMIDSDMHHAQNILRAFTH